MNADELDREIQQTIRLIQSDIDIYEERVAIENPDDGKTTTERALAALERPERFKGEHEVAMTWLRGQGVNGGSFKRIVR